MQTLIQFFTPWEFSWLVQVSCWGVLLIFVRGLRRGVQPGFWRGSAFVLGVLLMYVVTQTHFDYWSQYMFFVHRGQHLVLHHLAPLLIALAAPGAVLAAGMPVSVKRWFAGQNWLGRWWIAVYRFLQQPFLASLLFVGLIAFWLTPDIHFDAMLNQRLYWVMNWSMALDGLLFWWLMLAPTSHQHPAAAGDRQGLSAFDSVRVLNSEETLPARSSVVKSNRSSPLDRLATNADEKWALASARDRITPQLSYGVRMLLLAAIMVPQIIIGARLFFSRQVLFDVYAVCGRAWPISPLTDQQLGGLITWIPAAMMSVIAALILLRRLLHAQADQSVAEQPDQSTAAREPL